MILALAWWASLALLEVQQGTPSAQARADSSWNLGRYREAVVDYHEALKEDPRSVRAHYRIAVWLSWEGRLDSARVMMRNARAIEPLDRDLQVEDARILAWAGRFREAIALYDSVSAVEPQRLDARLGRAQAMAWEGRFQAADSTYEDVLRQHPDHVEALQGQAQVASWRGHPAFAEGLYRRILERHPENVDAWVGLARLHHQQGRERSAGQQLQRALAIAPESPAARRLAQDVRASRRPQLETTLRLSQDSDRNVVWSRIASTAWAIADGVRGFASGSSVLASDPTRDATGAGGELGMSVAHGRYQVTAAAGGRRLSPDASIDRSASSYRGALSARLVPSVVIGAGYSRVPFDENAALIGSRIDVEAWEASGEAHLPGQVEVSGSAAGAWLSDGNRRHSVSLAVSRPIESHSTLGLAARTLGYDQPGSGYFSPNRFSSTEVRAAVSLRRGVWSSATRAGLGAQQVGEGAAGQLEWHVDQALRFGWSAANQIELSVTGSNSATSSTTGAYSSFGTGLAIRIGL